MQRIQTVAKSKEFFSMLEFEQIRGHKMSKVRLVFRGQVLGEQDFDRVPNVGEVIIYSGEKIPFVIEQGDFLYVREVFWRPDGHASLMVSNRQLFT